MVEFSKWYTFSKIVVEPMTGNVVICVVDAVMYVVVSKAEKQCLIGNLLVPQNK